MLITYPVVLSVALELRFAFLENEFQIFSFATAIALGLFMFVMWLALCLISFSYSSEERYEHPLVKLRFGVIFETQHHFLAILATYLNAGALILGLMT